MNSITIIGKHKIRFYKPNWKEEELFDAECVDMIYKDGCIFADIRVTWKKSLGGFMKRVFPSLYITNAIYIKSVLKTLKKMYDDDLERFKTTYSSRLDYSGQGKALRNYQIEMVYRTANAKSKLLALDMGLGKSLISSTVARVVNSPRTSIICPAIVKYNFYEDMCHGWGYNEMNWSILEANVKKSMRAIQERFLVLNYEIIEKYDKHLNSSDITCFIIDECHNLKNVQSQRMKNTHKLFKKHPKAKRILLSGTPWTNRVTDLFSYLKLCDHPLGRNKRVFEDTYALKNGSKVVGVKNIEDLKFKIGNFMIRLKSDDVLELPKLSIQRSFFNMGDLQNEYNDVVRELQKIKDEYDNEEDDDKKKEFKFAAKIRSSISSMSRITAMSKIPAVVDWAKQLIEQGEDVVIFSSWRTVLAELETYFPDNSVRIDGSVPAKQRQVNVNKFVKDKGTNIFLGQVKAAGVGINLVNARYIMMMDVPISPDLIEQPIKRCHRSGQTRPVFAYFAISRGTIDERIYNLITEKSGDINAIIDADTKKGVIDYSDIPEQLFKELTN